MNNSLHKSLKIVLWDKIVGHLALTNKGVPVFEYESSFKLENLEISPFEIPLSTTLLFYQTHESKTFNGLPGVFADHLPDRFGMRVLHDFYKHHYQLEDNEIDVIKKLLYVGTNGIGALEFLPAMKTESFHDTLEISNLRLATQRIIEKSADKEITDMLRIGASAGGAQPKALIDYNPKTQEIRSAHSSPTMGFVPSIIKFDGLNDGEESHYYKKLEYIYSLMAQRCAIEMPKTYIYEETNGTHFIVERFDRSPNKDKIYHYASLCGLLIKDFYQKHSCSYEEFFTLTQRLTLDTGEVIKAFRRAVFNIVFRNQDDHTKNVGYIMDKKGQWKLAPAFDLTYSFGIGNSMTHQMKFNGKDDHFEKDDFLKIGEQFGIKKNQVREILEQTHQTTHEFLKLARQYQLDRDFARGVERNFRRL